MISRIYILIAAVLLTVSCAESSIKKTSSKKASNTLEEKKIANEFKLIKQRVYIAMSFSWAEWGTYPEKISFVKVKTPTKNTMHLDGQQQINGEKVKVEIVESGKNGKVKLKWKDKVVFVKSRL